MHFYSTIGMWLAGVLLMAPLGCSSAVHADPSPSLDSHSLQGIHLVASRGQAVPRTEVRDLRFHSYEEYTRLVLDLAGPVDFTESGQQDNGQVLIRLENTSMEPQAHQAKRLEGFPKGVEIFPTKGGAVHVWLDPAIVGEYKLFALDGPERLVLDLYYNGGKARQAPAPTPTVVVIDPGHGGKDPGAVGRKGTQEKDIVLDVARALRKLLEKRMNVKVLMTRDRDVFIELEDRTAFANAHKADLFVSIHVNSHPRRSIKGVEIYHFGKATDQRALEVAARENGKPVEESGVVGEILGDFINGQKTIRSKELAYTTSQSLVTHIRQHFPVNDHGVKSAPFYVLRFTTMPSILAEIAFVSNPVEERRLRTASFQQHMAEAIFQGLEDYMTTYMNGGPLQTASR